MIDIQLFEQLVAFSDWGTLSAASEKLHISQPALSRAMQRLEREMDVSLFDRQAGRLTLNANGELAVRHARNLLLQEQTLIQQVRDFDRKNRTICVGSCAPVVIPEMVSLLSRLYEGMTISTEVTGDPGLADKLKENRYQLVILHEKPDEREFYSQPMGNERLFVFLPPAHPLSDAKGLYLKDLDGQTFLLHSQIGFWDGLCRRKMPSTRFLMQPDLDVLNELVANSALPAFTTDYFLERTTDRPDRHPYPGRGGQRNLLLCLSFKRKESFYACFPPLPESLVR